MGSAGTTSLPEVPAPAPVAPALVDRTGHLLARAHFLVRDYADEVLAPFGLVIRQHAALAVIGDEGPVSQQSLGAKLACDRTTMVELMDDLEERGLTERQRNPADRRAYAIELTRKGEATLREARTRLEAAEDALLAPLSPAERADLHDLLLRLLTR